MKPDLFPASEAGSLDAHLTPASPSGWALWRIVECRTAGFAASLVLALAHDDAAARAQALTLAVDRLDAGWVRHENACRELVRQRVPRARDADAASPEASELALARRLLRAVQRRKVDAELHAYLGDAAVNELAALQQHLDAAERDFRSAHADAAAQASRAITAVAALPAFQEAVVWQNKRVHRDVLTRLDEASPASRRRHEELVASYLQRYAVKNDTIGFFGPVGWASWCERTRGATVELGAQPLAARQVYFEDWAIEALAQTLSRRDELVPWMVPELAPFLRLDGEALALPGGGRSLLSAQERELLAACDGHRTAGQIARRLLADPFSEFDAPAEVLATLQRLRDARRIRLDFPVRISDPWPERQLRRQLEAIEPHELRAPALATLDALEALDEQFSALTRREASRGAGMTYAGRGLVYEDCRRDAAVHVGADLRERLQAPLDLVLTSARWFTDRAARLFLRSLTAAFHAQGVRELDLPTFWLRVQSSMYGDGPEGLGALRAELSDRWRSLLAVDDGGAELRLRSADLKAAVQHAFHVEGSVWPGALVQSPDVMIAAGSTDAIAEGRCRFVLGEIHVGMNTLLNHSAVQQHERPEQLLRAARSDRRRPRVMPLISRSGTAQPVRVQTVIEAGADVEVQFSLDTVPHCRERALRLADLVVTDSDAGLVVRARDGSATFPVLDFFQELIAGHVADKFRMIETDAAQMPRIVIDDLVVQRRTFRVRAADLAFADRKGDEAGTYAACLRWAGQLGLPRFSFVKLPWEKKPIYLDLASPLYVRMLVKQIRKRCAEPEGAQAWLSLSEMLPAHDELWMPLQDGQRCTSEFRIVAVGR